MPAKNWKAEKLKPVGQPVSQSFFDELGARFEMPNWSGLYEAHPVLAFHTFRFDLLCHCLVSVPWPFNI